jgi:ABC-type uncharacterized transport system substrate-binding protein
VDTVRRRLGLLLIPTLVVWPGAAYGPPFPTIFRQAAVYTDKLLRGAKPADLPVEDPSKFELIVNQKAAAALGLTIPPSLLLRADRVIQ